ncbi:hypothetical protein [Rhodococcus sp. X156]|uniref:hypothetical protein n=1 Tax=Rhodococcus sp. X156 TaxID=2499145 RepID=UPI0019D257F5|nr:hypothetical protein [Rhodococcus sp. X156]
MTVLAQEINVDLGDDSMTRPLMTMFLAVLVTFLGTRYVTRHIRARTTPGGALNDLTIGGVHVHHQVFGIALMLLAGLGLIGATPEGAALHVFAALFGIGVSLTFDEFALWLHLEDVYWTEDGRKSVDAMFCVLATTGLLVGGADFVSGAPLTAAWWGSVALLVVDLVLAVVCLLKAKVLTGVVAVFVPPVGLAGALRLAKPRSWWAQRRYRERPRRRARAEQRFDAAYEARWNRVRDFVGGAPNA